MRPIFTAFDPDRDWNLVKFRLGLKWVEDTRGIVAVDLETNKRVAIAVFNNWTWSAVQVHLWIEHPMIYGRGFIFS